MGAIPFGNVSTDSFGVLNPENTGGNAGEWLPTIHLSEIRQKPGIERCRAFFVMILSVGSPYRTSEVTDFKLGLHIGMCIE